jgi:hypothetical protein
LKYLFAILLILLLSSNACYSATIKITADYKHYDKYRDVLIAKGNVVVEGPDFKIMSPYVIRYFKDDKIVAMDRFEMEKEGYRIAGSSIEYYYWKEAGNADKIRINFGETFIGGRYMTITPDKFEIYDAYFTGCNQPSSHYHFSAQQATLYPKTGLIVAYYATCWVWIAPVIPVPTFIYSAPVPRSRFVVVKPKAKLKEIPTKQVKEQREGIKTTQPVPQIGANPVDGNFIRQGFNWYFTPRSYAKLLVSYAEKNHFGAGLSTNYILDERSEGEVRIGSNEIERFYWGMTHYFALGPKLLSKEEEQWLLYDFYKPGGKYAYELELKYSVRERPNLDKNSGPFSRVSMTPKVTFRSNRQPLPLLGEPFTYFWEASHATTVSEEVSVYETTSTEGYITSSPLTNYFTDINYKNDVPWLGSLKATVNASFSDYDKLGSWDRSMQIISLSQNLFDRLTLEEGHYHYIMQRGKTPYLFEGYYYSIYDQFVGKIALKAWYSTFQIRTSYDLPSWDPTNINYQWLFGLHCYNLIFEHDLRYEVDRFYSTFNFSFELEPSRW